MDVPQFTPQRQKTLMGVGAAGVLLVLGFSFAPSLELADKKGAKEVDDTLALVDEERGAAPVVEKTTARALRRARLSATREMDASPSKEPAAEQPRAIVEAPAKAITETTSAPSNQVIPPSYKERLALLAEEEEALARHQKRPRGAEAATEAAPIPKVSQASVETEENADGGVEHALAQARRPGRMRRVELIFGESESTPARDVSAKRGAWLSGKIEIE